jgi:hypothetical protein
LRRSAALLGKPLWRASAARSLVFPLHWGIDPDGFDLVRIDVAATHQASETAPIGELASWPRADWAEGSGTPRRPPADLECAKRAPAEKARELDMENHFAPEPSLRLSSVRGKSW